MAEIPSFFVFKTLQNNHTFYMEYVKGKPYFAQGEKIKQYPYVNCDFECEILIVGGGIDGAIANYYLSQKYDVILVDKSRFGLASTSCATVLLEYQLDDFAQTLKKYMTQKEIVDVYKMGLYSIQKINSFINKNGNHCYFNNRPTLLYSSSKKDKKSIVDEYNFRISNGFECELITAKNNPFPFEIEYGLFCKNGGCEFNPYLFTKQLIESASNQNKLFENTKIESFTQYKNYVIAQTNFGQKIKCKKLVLATGFNWELIKSNSISTRTVSYTIVTTKNDITWKDFSLIQDNETPYHYLRKLADGRIIFGGEDTKFNNKNIKQKTAQKKYQKLEKSLKELFKSEADKIEIEYKFCGCFGSTKNNLGVIGKSEFENVYYFFSNGANGVINGMYAVELLEDIFSGKSNKFEKLFSPSRKTK